MGSRRKKAEKEKDFKKKKLKVGKTALKPDNHTDTSFKAKTISTPNQGLGKNKENVSDPLKKQELDLNHHLALTKHHSSASRKEVLIYLEQHLPSNPSLYKQILNSITPMIHDSSLNVQTALVALFKKCGEKQDGLLSLHVKSIILFILSAMTHIQPVIRNGSTKFLLVLLDFASTALIKSYFIKVLKTYFHLLSWSMTNDKKAMSLAITTGSSIGGSTKKARIGHLNVLKQFLKLALFEDTTKSTLAINIDTITIHPQSYKYLLPDVPQPFSGLKLFTTELPKKFNQLNYNLQDLDTISADDLSTRRKVVQDVFLKPMVYNLNSLLKEGGEVGKEANSLLALIKEFEQSLIDEKSQD